MKKLIFIILTNFSIQAFGEISLPEGWRKPSSNDYSEDDRNYLKGNFPNTVKADFNGDSITDFAMLLISNDNKQFSLVVAFGSTNKKYIYKTLDTNNFLSKLFMGISAASTEPLKTACGKGYWECSKEEPEEIQFANPAIDYFKFESASSTFYWDKESKGFKRIWISD